MHSSGRKIIRRLVAILDPGYLLLVVAVVGLTYWNVTLSRRLGSLKTQVEAGHGLSGPAEAQTGDFMPHLQGTNLDGLPIDIRYDGSTRYLYFVFSPLCPACNRQFPTWRAVSSKARDAHVAVRWLSVEEGPVTERHLADLGPRDSILLVPNWFLRAYRVAAVPQTMLVSPTGEVEWSHTGEISLEGIRALEGKIDVTR